MSSPPKPTSGAKKSSPGTSPAPAPAPAPVPVPAPASASVKSEKKPKTSVKPEVSVKSDKEAKKTCKDEAQEETNQQKDEDDDEKKGGGAGLTTAADPATADAEKKPVPAVPTEPVLAKGSDVYQSNVMELGALLLTYGPTQLKRVIHPWCTAFTGELNGVPFKLCIYCKKDKKTGEGYLSDIDWQGQAQDVPEHIIQAMRALCTNLVDQNLASEMARASV